MASCDDDFAILGDEATQQQPPHHHHHHHQPSSFATNAHHHVRFLPASAPKPSPASAALHHHASATKKPVVPAGSGDYGDSPFCSQPAGFRDKNDEEVDARAAVPVPVNDGPSINNTGNSVSANPFADDGMDRKSGKRKERDDVIDVGNASGSFSQKKSKSASALAASTCGGIGDYRKDREEWSDSAIGCLLDAYMDKFVQLNRGNLRGRDWVEVAAIVSERADQGKTCCDKQKMSKSVEQCKNKMDNLKKRYKVELQRMSSTGSHVSHWTWFKKMELIVGSSLPGKASASDDDKSNSSVLTPRQAKRVATPGSVPLVNNMKTKSVTNLRWRRVVLKISGAVLAGSGPQNVDPKVMMLIAKEVADATRVGVEVAIVTGGRNFFCEDTWVTTAGIDKTTAYQLGMMATVMNSILLQALLEKMGVQTRVQTAFTMQEAAEPYNRQRAIRHLEKGRVVIFGGIGAGFGNQLFNTDTAAALCASEINAGAVLKGTNVDGVYDTQSRSSNGITFEHTSFREFASRGFRVMNMTAISCCEENGIPVVIFNLLEPGNIYRALCGDQVGTLIDQSGRVG